MKYNQQISLNEANRKRGIEIAEQERAKYIERFRLSGCDEHGLRPNKTRAVRYREYSALLNPYEAMKIIRSQENLQHARNFFGELTWTAEEENQMLKTMELDLGFNRSKIPTYQRNQRIALAAFFLFCLYQLLKRFYL